MSIKLEPDVVKQEDIILNQSENVKEKYSFHNEIKETESPKNGLIKHKNKTSEEQETVKLQIFKSEVCSKMIDCSVDELQVGSAFLDEKTSNSETVSLSEKNSESESLSCQYCFASLDNQVYLEAHLFNAHGQKFGQDSILSRLTNDLDSGGKPVSVQKKCNYSDKTIITIKTFEDSLLQNGVRAYTTSQEIKSDLNKDRHKCDICFKSFKHKTSLKRHMLTHHSKPSICQFCNKNNNYKSEIVPYLQHHTNPYKWLKCVRHHCKLEQHVKSRHATSLSDKPKGLKVALSLNSVRKERPYICQYCKRSYCHKRDLNRHHNVKHSHLLPKI